MTARGTWKRDEAEIAHALGGRRIPVTGIDRDGADVITPLFHIQAKLRRSLPKWLWTWLSGICATTAPGKVGVLILRTPRMRRSEALVVLRFQDFVDLHGQPAREVDVNGVEIDGP